MLELHVLYPFLPPSTADCRDGEGAANTSSSLTLKLCEMLTLGHEP